MKWLQNFHKNTFSSLKIRNYRLYFIGQGISLCGTWMQTIGQSWLVLQLTNSGFQLGLVTALQFLPVLILGPYGGVIADRFSKRRLLYMTQTIAGLLSLILGLLIVTHTVNIWMVDILAFLSGMVKVVDNPTRQVFVPEMVERDQLSNAISLNSSEFNLARIIGPALGGVMIAALGLAPLFLLDALSYIAVLIMLYLMHEKELHIVPPAPRVPGQLRQGFSYVNSNPILKNTLIMMAIVGTFAYEFTVILPLVAQNTFHGNAGTYALLTSAMGVGAVAGGLYTASRKKVSPKMLVISCSLFGVSLIVMSLSPTLFIGVLLMIVVGALSINFTSLGNTTLQLESDPKMRGRVMALWSVAFLGSTPIGGPIIGWIGQFAGPRWGLAVGGIATIIAAGIGLQTIRKQKAMEVTLENKEAEMAAEEDLRVL